MPRTVSSRTLPSPRVSLGRAQPCTGRATTRGQRRRIKEHSTWRPTTRCSRRGWRQLRRLKALAALGAQLPPPPPPTVRPPPPSPPPPHPRPAAPSSLSTSTFSSSLLRSSLLCTLSCSSSPRTRTNRASSSSAPQLLPASPTSSLLSAGTESPPWAPSLSCTKPSEARLRRQTRRGSWRLHRTTIRTTSSTARSSSPATPRSCSSCPSSSPPPSPPASGGNACASGSLQRRSSPP
mmetsp:Transcript_33899/g.80764  ORF Transcript_33899/g.80764 Transcript_33899/m.80764 type:complete len:236 (-) Transcript_33899:488-1195(-)